MADDGAIECLRGEALASTVRKAVFSTQAIDVHTHLFPEQHGSLLLWGIDEMLTYHYLVSEMFMVAPAELTAEAFFAMPKSQQADLVWKYLFIDRSPLSEAQLGVLRTLQKLGLADLVAKKDLVSIRQWFAEQDALKHIDKIFQLAGLKYVVMTNIPFDAKEAATWVKESAQIDLASESFASADVYEQTFCATRFRTALRIDPLLKGDWGTISSCLAARGLPQTMEGTRVFLKAWAKVYNAEYLMASTPADFAYGSSDTERHPGWPTATQLIDEVMVPVAEELRLPLAMKLGAKRGMNPDLNPCGGGDGVCISDVGPLEELCRRCPRVKFLATFLSRVNQHEVCVLAQKFRNLHIYGCWWYCNNPSMIEEITRMRMEMLGTAFTAQHSDSRVLDQLVYKWDHSRQVIAEVLVRQFDLLAARGWPISAKDVERDVWRLFGGAYEEFMAKDACPNNSSTSSSHAQPPREAAGTWEEHLVRGMEMVIDSLHVEEDLGQERGAETASQQAEQTIPPPVPASDLPKRRPPRKALTRNFARYCLPGAFGCGC
mmetsp:Transcript_752/g.1588  ORF Transcript_752/g.1588 Transcript_752/m.1588 type:complete len:546 (+) Transcript_752:99-1736(+)